MVVLLLINIMPFLNTLVNGYPKCWPKVVIFSGGEQWLSLYWLIIVILNAYPK